MAEISEVTIMGIDESKYGNWREKELSLNEVIRKYPDNPKFIIIKTDIQRRGVNPAPLYDMLTMQYHCGITSTNKYTNPIDLVYKKSESGQQFYLCKGGRKEVICDGRKIAASAIKYLIRLPKEEMAKFAVFLLLYRIRGVHRSVVRMKLEGELVIRSSCSPINDSNMVEYFI